jgi:hypothetical protein
MPSPQATLFVLLLAVCGCFAQMDPAPLREYMSFDGWLVYRSHVVVVVYMP